MKKRLIAIVGPTASGKSAAAVDLAAKIGGEVVSADSVQVYRGLTIGSGKITPEEMMTAGKMIPHHMLDIADPREEYNIARYQKDAAAAIAGIHERGKLPVLCGGSGLYVHSIVNSSYRLDPEEVDWEYRRTLRGMVKEKGLPYLYGRLAAAAPSLAEKIHPNDEKRIIRGLEKVKNGQTEAARLHWESPYDVKMVGLYVPRDVLYAKIEARVDKMVAMGLVDEVKGLLAQGIAPESNALQALGYKEIVPFLQGQCEFCKAVQILKRNTRHFAKRQLTWFMRDPRIIWININSLRNSDKIGQEIFRIVGQEK